MTGKETAAETDGALISTRQMRHLHAVLRDHGITGDKGIHDYINTELAEHDEGPVDSRTELLTGQAARIIAGLESEPAAVAGTLASALLAFQAELPRVVKSQTANVPMKAGGSYSYSYADLAAVTDAAIPLLNKHRMTFTAMPRHTDRGYELVGVLRHISGEADEGALPLHGNSPQDIGGSITYGRRYLLGCMTGIVTEDDNDAAHTRGAGISRTREWDGPSTAALLNAIDSDAQRAGVTYEVATAKWRQQRGNMTIEQLDSLDPWLVQPLAEAVKARADEVAAAAAATPPAGDQPAAAGQPAEGDPWSTPGPGSSGEQPPA